MLLLDCQARRRDTTALPNGKVFVGQVATPGLLVSLRTTRYNVERRDTLTHRPHRFVVRLPEELRDRIAEAAELYRRSMNSEIVARLDASFGREGGDSADVEPPFFQHIETSFRRDLTEDENALIRRFRSLSNRQRTALLDLLQGY